MSCHPGCQVYHNLFCNAGNIVDHTGDGSHSSGLTIYNNTLYAGNGTMVNDKALIEAIADMWGKVGIRARIEMMEMGARQRMNNDRRCRPPGVC
jgi:ABC-type transport system substrate-binding protein